MVAASKDRSQEDDEFVLEEAPPRQKKREEDKDKEVQRYEVRLGPPMVSARKVRPSRAEGLAREATVGPEGGTGGGGDREGKGTGAQYANSQHIYKIEDDLRRTRDIVEDLKHTTSLLEGDMRDLKAEMERISYLLRSLEGLKNAMKDIESTVSELSGLYDMISANVNPFIDIPKMDAKDNGQKAKEPRPAPHPTGGRDFVELSEIFDDVEVGTAEEPLKRPRPREGQGTLDSEEWLLRWTQFLLGKVGKEGLEKALDHYRELGWIDGDIMERVMDIAKGTTAPTPPPEGKKTGWRMEAEDHMRSLEIIRMIRGKRSEN